MSNDYSQVLEVLETYLDALHHTDEKRIADVFHESALYAMSTDTGGVMTRTMDEYIPVIAKRESPASRGEEKVATIHSIEFGGPNTAFARVSGVLGSTGYVDLITLMKIDGKWRFLTKIFHTVPA
ncbi:nuclear transport factor 2 family protein [Stappia sp. GBMRC 2046]|uniref:Nuclear transport factor 2 family protein n=1 Tax=Stappia sediminis TaxID=2692190 RepID=A0A7X3LTT8_9HYPH|nr:nuclear transport factor 2 family protein [Stappia sediminis]MXN65001.1 nuclear transport factor 2 family protein [Stappia sediminis]